MTQAEAATPETTIVRKAPSFPLHEIVEVQDCGRRAANLYLAQGYVLLAVVQWADGRPHPKDPSQIIVARDARYVLGRTKEIPHFEHPFINGSRQDGASETS